jgi:hypothetical protein
MKIKKADQNKNKPKQNKQIKLQQNNIFIVELHNPQ